MVYRPNQFQLFTSSPTFDFLLPLNGEVYIREDLVSDHIKSLIPASEVHPIVDCILLMLRCTNGCIIGYAGIQYGTMLIGRYVDKVPASYVHVLKI